MVRMGGARDAFEVDQESLKMSGKHLARTYLTLHLQHAALHAQHTHTHTRMVKRTRRSRVICQDNGSFRLTAVGNSRVERALAGGPRAPLLLGPLRTPRADRRGGPPCRREAVGSLRTSRMAPIGMPCLHLLLVLFGSSEQPRILNGLHEVGRAIP